MTTPLNADLPASIAASKSAGHIIDELGNVLIQMVENHFGHRWKHLTYLEPYKAIALAAVVDAALKFDPTKSDNPFAYYTGVIHVSVRQAMYEAKQMSSS